MTPEQLDSKIAELVSQRIRMNAPRDYERHFVYALNDEGDATATTLEKTLFRTLFGLSHSYSSTHTEGSSILDKTIEDALMNTPKIFPDSAFVACQGIEGAYSQIATDKLFANADIMYFRTFDGVFHAVEAGLCKYGVLPIENSSYGSVTQVYDLMKSHKFHIVRAMKLQISHRLLAKPGTKHGDIKEVYSHSQAIG